MKTRRAPQRREVASASPAARALLACGCILLICSVTEAAPYGTNLLINGNAETGSGSPTGDPVPVAGWTTTSTFTIVPYGSPGGFPVATKGPPDAGAQFFAGGNSASSTATQDIDVSGNAVNIDAGQVFCDVSAWLGGFADQNDDATFTVTFKQDAATDLGTITVGPVTAADRQNTTRLLQRIGSAIVPANTRIIRAVATMARKSAGTFNDGYADSLSVILRGPFVVTTTANSGAGSLRDALTKGSFISFDAGVFGGGATITLSTALGIAKSCTIDGGNAVTISGGDTTGIAVIGRDLDVTLKNLTLTKGLNKFNDGGAIENKQVSRLVIDNCKFIANETSSAFSGGAIATTGPMTVTRSEFSHNRAGNAGAIYPKFDTAAVQITDCNLHDNTTLNTTTGWGGAILVWDGAAVTLTNTRLANNGALSGGAVYVRSSSSLSALASTFESNYVPAGSGRDGGAIHSSGTTSVSESVFDDNHSPIAGAVFADAGTFTATASSFTNNVSTDAASAGAVDNVTSATLVNCTIARNSSPTAGGIRNTNPGTISLTNCTIASNSATAGAGGGIVTNSGTTLNNTLLANNSATTGGADISGAATGDYNLIKDATGLTFTGGTHNITGKDPALDPAGPKNNGGTSATIALLSGSVAIDAASSNLAPPTDQRGAAHVGAPDIGAYEFGATPTPTPTPSPTPDPTAPPARSSQLLNLSTRKQVGTGDNVLIGGFIVAGNQPKKIIIRGLGPGLPVNGALADPTLELHDGTGALVAQNNNWQETQAAEIAATGIPPNNDLDSAIVATLPAQALNAGGASYTGVLAGNNGGTGIGVLEIYDLAVPSDSRLANISTRGFVGNGDDVLIGGFIPGPSDRSAMNVLVRAVGPSLAAAGVSGVLEDPLLELHDGNGNTLLVNDSWRDALNAGEIEATGIPPSDDRECAILATLPASNSGYTAVVRGLNDTTGVALVEVYSL